MIPEHDPIEVEPDAASASGSARVHAHTHAADHPDARGIIVACLAQVLPCPVCSRTEPCRCIRPDGYSATAERAELIEAALIEFGHLPDTREEQPFSAEDTAKWLAERSGFARYTQVEDGWKRLMESEIDVDLATLNALKRVPTSEVDMVKAAKAALLSWHQSNKSTPGWMR